METIDPNRTDGTFRQPWQEPAQEDILRTVPTIRAKEGGGIVSETIDHTIRLGDVLEMRWELLWLCVGDVFVMCYRCGGRIVVISLKRG